MLPVNDRQKHIVDVIFVLALFAFFALSSIMLIALGANVYKRNVEKTSENTDLRTSAAYVSQKVRQNDFHGDVSVSSFDNLQALVLNETINDVSYSTRLYFHDGYLCELFSRTDLTMNASAGTKIMPLKSMLFTALSDDLTRVDFVEPDGTARSVFLDVRTELPAAVPEETVATQEESEKNGKDGD